MDIATINTYKDLIGKYMLLQTGILFNFPVSQSLFLLFLNIVKINKYNCCSNVTYFYSITAIQCRNSFFPHQSYVSITDSDVSLRLVLGTRMAQRKVTGRDNSRSHHQNMTSACICDLIYISEYTSKCVRFYSTRDSVIFVWRWTAENLLRKINIAYDVMTMTLAAAFCFLVC